MSNEHNSLKRAVQELVLMDIRVDGAESFLTDVLGKLKQVGGYATDQALIGIQAGVKSATSGIIKTLGTRRMFIAHLNSRLGKEGLKDQSTFTSGFLKKVTRDGKVDDIIPALDSAQKTMDLLKAYVQELETYTTKELHFLDNIKNIKKPEDAVKILTGLESLAFPNFRLQHHAGRSSTSGELPGRKFIHYNEDNSRFSLGDIHLDAEEVTESFGKEDAKSVLTKLNKLVETYQYVVKALTEYLSYVKKFNTVVGTSFAHLDDLKGDISVSLISDLKSHLEGNAKVFAFYSGFLPKVIIYLDDYVDTLSSYLSKQFN